MFVKRLISRIFSIGIIISFLTTGVLTVKAYTSAAPLSANGDFLWAKSMGGTNYDYGSGITTDPSGNVYTTGSFQGTVDFDPGPGIFDLTSVGGSDIFVSKVDNDGNLIWAKSMGGTNAEGGYGIAVDPSGNVYTSGNITGDTDFDPGIGTFTLTSTGSLDVFVTKLDGNGDFIWAKSMGGLNDDTNNGMGLDSSGNVYTTGSFQGSADFDPGIGINNLTSAGVDDIFVSKLDSNGDFLWARGMGGTSSDWPQDMTVDSAGNVYTTGYFLGVTGTADFDPGPGLFTLTSAGSNDIFISKLDSNGNFVWARGMGGSSVDIGVGITVDSSSNVYTTGYFSNTVDFDAGVGTTNLTSAGNRDIFVSKLDANGDHVWANKMGGVGTDRGLNVAVDSSGNVYSSGVFVDSADFDPDTIDTFNLTSAGLDDIFISKVDGNGDFVWAKNIGGAGGDHISSIFVDSNNNLYTTGWFGSTADFDPDPSGTFNLTSAGFDDIFIAKFEGNVVEGSPTPTFTVTLQNTATPTTSTGDATTIRASVDSNNSQANGGNYKNEISDNGQIVAFQSLATNLVSNDTNGFSDILVRDRLSGQTGRVNISSSGNQANNYVADLSMSANGQFVAFWSEATNLVSGDTNGQSDVFVHNRQTGQTERVSVDSNGNQANSYSYEFSISADGRFVSFLSHASNLVSGDTNGKTDIFVHDRQTGQTELVSIDGGGNQANNHSDFSAISADGQFVVFRSTATNLVSGDTNGFADIFIRDRQTGQTQRINVDGSGNQANAGGSNETDGDRAELAVSADGRFVAFESLATNLISNDTNGVADIFIRDRQTGQTERVSIDSNGGQSNGASADLSMSDDGRFVAFRSDASNLAANDNNTTSDVFLHDRQTGQTERISLDDNGNEANNYSFWPSISANGQFISFGSFASNLVPNDTNNTADVFVRERASSYETATPTPTQTNIPTNTPTSTQIATFTATFTPSPIPYGWTLTSSMSLARWGHTATLLPDGRVLVAGGRNGSTTYANAEIFDPVTQQWSPTGSMNQARSSHTATLLPNGKVIVVGGGSNSSELYDPLTGLWTLSGTLNALHSSHTATLLANGKVLVSGGAFSLATAELYDPNTGLWTLSGSLNTGRYNHTATLLTNGKVLITGGVDANSPTANTLAASELYDPATGTWAFTGSLSGARTQHSSILLSDGTVLVAGGGFSSFLSTAELYDPITGTWTPTGSMAFDHVAQQNMLLLNDGRALIVGGASNRSEIYNPNTGIWSDMALMSISRQFHTTTLLLDGRVLTTGGNSSSPVSSAELYGPISVPTATPTDIPTSTSTSTPTQTSTATQTYTPTPTETLTFTPTGTDTPSPMPTGTPGPLLISSVDNVGNVGQYTSLELNSMGRPIISYYDATNGDLKMAVCGNTTCTTGNTVTTVDSSGNVGIWTSLALNSSGFPVMSYNDQTNGDLKVAVCGNATCTSGNTITTVDSMGNVGSWSSLALNSNDFPVISYIDETNSDLKVVTCGNETCTSGNTITTVDSDGYVGYFTSLALNSNGHPIISYWDQGNLDLKVAVCGNAACTSGTTISTVDSTGDVGRYSSLALNSNGYPVISYWDVTNHDLKVAICGDTTCTFANTLTTVDNSPGDVGHYTSLTLTSGDLPVISYYDYNNGDLKLALCGDVVCSSNNTLTVVDSIGYAGTYTSLELNSAGFPVISYFDNTNLDLKVAVCGSTTCDSSASPTLTNTPVPTQTDTPSPTLTNTPTFTPTFTFTPTPTDTPTITPTPDLNINLLAPANGEQLLYNRPTFDWTDAPDAVSYTIQISNNIGFTSPTSNTVTISTYTQPTNLTANVTRYWRVQANTPSGTGPWSEIRNFKTANPPSAAGLTAPANNGLITDYTPLLDWNNSTVPVGTTFLKYELQIATDSLFTSPTIIDISGSVTDSSYTPPTELDSNTTYYWRVRAFNTLGHYSAWSTRSFRTALLPPVLNTPNDADQLLNNRPTFDWNDVPGVTGYRIQISEVGDFATTLVSAVVTPSIYVRTTDLPANTTLYWRVQSRGANGPGAWSDVRILTTANPPSVPTLVSPANNAEVSGASLLFNWDDALLPVGIAFDHYQIQVATSNTFTTIVHDQTISGITNSQGNSALLIPAATYWWRVRSFNVDGHSSAWSTVRSVRIKFAGPILNLPADGSTAGDLTPTFTWDAVSGATNYTLQVSKNSSFSPLVINTIASTNSYTHGTNLQAGTIYYWRVRVNTPAAYGPGDWSQVYSFTTP